MSSANSEPWYKGSFKDWIFTTDHKKIGAMYLLTTIIFFIVAGIMGMLIRIEQSSPGIFLPSIGGKSGADLYNYILTGHGAVMLLWWGVNVWLGGFANILVPIMIGAKDVAFPRLNAFGYWSFFGASVLVLLSMIPGNWIMMLWTGYPPLSTIEIGGATIIYSAVLLLYSISSTANSVNMVTTILSMRAKNISFLKMNLFTHGILGASFINLFGVPALIGASVLLFTDRYLGTTFFNPSVGGDPLLFQHLLWFYSHPVVYIMILPAFGVFSEVISTMSRKPIFGYVSMVIAIYLITIIGFFTWVHHMFVAGLPNIVRIIFSYSTLLIAVPTGIKIFNWLATLYKGSIRLNTPMLFIIGALTMFLIGGLTGVSLAMLSINLGVSDSLYVVGHFHYVLGMSVTFGAIGAIYYWMPKLVGKMPFELPGKVSFWLVFVGSNIFYFFQMLAGAIHGIPRRYPDYPPIPEWIVNMQIQTVGAIILAIGILISFINFILTIYKGEKATDNPYQSPSIEWAYTTSPISKGNFKKFPIEVDVDWHPYSYYKGYHVHF